MLQNSPSRRTLFKKMGMRLWGNPSPHFHLVWSTPKPMSTSHTKYLTPRESTHQRCLQWRHRCCHSQTPEWVCGQHLIHFPYRCSPAAGQGAVAVPVIGKAGRSVHKTEAGVMLAHAGEFLAAEPTPVASSRGGGDDYPSSLSSFSPGRASEPSPVAQLAGWTPGSTAGPAGRHFPNG